MENYQIIESTNIDGTITKHIVVDKGDGHFTSFPALNDNPHYQAWLAQGNTLPPNE